VNYYEHHLGDYDGATAHLSWHEDCAYRRLLCLYYRTEAPLPADVKQICRLVRAASKPERDAVQQVLREFFELSDDGWHNARCDEDIAAFHESEPDREAKKENSRERQRRSRERRRTLFEELRGHNIVPAWDTSTKHLEALLSRVTTGVTDASRVTEPVTPVTRDDTATQTPPPTSHLPPPSPKPVEGSLREPGGDDPEDWRQRAVGEIAAAMKRAGVSRFQAGDPRAIELYRQGATTAEFEALAAEAVGKGIREPWQWLLKVLPERRAEAQTISLAPPPSAPPWPGVWSEVVQRGAALGMPWSELTPEGRARSRERYRSEVVAAWNQRESAQGAPA